MNTLDQSNTSVQNYLNIFSQYNYTNEINIPTYHSPISNSDTSCIDHIWNNLNIPKKSFVVKPNISDHYATCLLLNKKCNAKLHRIKFRNFSAVNIEKFQTAMQSEFLRFSPTSHLVNDYSNYLEVFLKKILNKYFPVMTKCLSEKRLKSPWITSAIVKCIRKKFRWYRLMKQNLILRASYREYAAELRKLLRVAEQEYYVRRFNSLDRDMKRNWKILNTLLGKNSGKKKNQ